MNATEPFSGLPAFSRSSSTLSLTLSYKLDNSYSSRPYMVDVRLVQQTFGTESTKKSRLYFCHGGIR